MKKSKVLVLSLMFVVLGSYNSFASSSISNPDEIRKEIAELVSTIDVSEMENNTERVVVQFIVNAKNEIIVLNVSESDFESPIKNKLNYKKIDSEDSNKNQIYSVPVVFKKK